MAGSFSAVSPGPHRKGRDAAARHDFLVELTSRARARLNKPTSQHSPRCDRADLDGRLLREMTWSR